LVDVAAPEQLLRAAAAEVQGLASARALRGLEVGRRCLGPAARVGERVAELRADRAALGALDGPELERELVEARGAIEGERLLGLGRGADRVADGLVYVARAAPVHRE